LRGSNCTCAQIRADLYGWVWPGRPALAAELATRPEKWTKPWNGRIGVGLAGYSELCLDDVVERTIAVAHSI
jgi:hypothetical protein